MAELKTKLSDASVGEFINKLSDEQTKQNCFRIIELMHEITKEPPKMWGSSIVGFGNYHYIYNSGRKGDWFLVGLSPRKQNITLYMIYGFEKYKDLLKNLGKYKTGKSCLYIKKLSDINIDILKVIIEGSYNYMKVNFRSE